MKAEDISCCDTIWRNPQGGIMLVVKDSTREL